MKGHMTDIHGPGERLTRKQTTSRPDNEWTDMWKHMSDASKRKAKQKWAVEKPKLDNARQLRSIFFIQPEDEDFKNIMEKKNARRMLDLNPGSPRPRRRTRLSSKRIRRVFSNPRQDSSWYDGEAKSEFWSISGDFIYRHHMELRVKLYVPTEESFPFPLKYIDVTRTTDRLKDAYLGGLIVEVAGKPAATENSQESWDFPESKSWSDHGKEVTGKPVASRNSENQVILKLEAKIGHIICICGESTIYQETAPEVSETVIPTIDFKEPTWRSMTLLCDKAIEITNAKTCVFADTVLCLGSVSDQPVEACKNRSIWKIARLHT